MTYYINPIWFYLMDVSTGLKIFLCLVGGCLTAAFGMTIIGCILEESDVTDLTNMDENTIKLPKIFKKLLITGIILIFIGMFLPSKEACIEMMVASHVTHENVTATKEEIYEITDYVTYKVKGEEK